MNKNEAAATLHFYQGADGPSLLFRLDEEAHLEVLKQILQRLSDGTHEVVSLKESGVFRALNGLDDLLLVLRRGDNEPSRSVKKIITAPTECKFHFERPKDGWLECVELLDGLKSPGHQYLSRGPADEAVVIVSYRENLSVRRI